MIFYAIKPQKLSQECAAVMNIEDPLKPHSNYWKMLGPTKDFHVAQNVKYEAKLSFAIDVLVCFVYATFSNCVLH